MTTQPTTAPSQISPPLRAALQELLRPLSEGIETANEQLTDLPVLSERQASTNRISGWPRSPSTWARSSNSWAASRPGRTSPSPGSTGRARHSVRDDRVTRRLLTGSMRPAVAAEVRCCRALGARLALSLS